MVPVLLHPSHLHGESEWCGSDSHENALFFHPINGDI